MKTVGEAVSRVRNIIKAVDMDDFITDRTIYSLIMKYAAMYIKRQSAQGTGSKFSSLFVRLPCLELIDVDRVEACCDPKSGVLIKRTKDKVPNIMEGPQGPLLRSVASIDGYTEATRTTPTLYNSMSKTSSFKYNKNVYYWILDNYIYLPTIEWDSISVEGIFDAGIAGLACDDPCVQRQDQLLGIPPELFAEIEQQVVADFFKSAQIPQDQFISDKQSVFRS